MPTPEEIQAKSDATRLKNILTKQADKTPLSPQDKAFLKKQKATAARAETGEKPSWLSEPASINWRGRKIKSTKTGKEYVIGDVFGEMHVEIEKDAKTTIHNAANLRESYEPI